MARGQKTGGRQKGTPNKVTGPVREILRQVIGQELELLPELLEELEPKERIDALIKLMPYVTPKVDASMLKNGEESVMLTHAQFVQNIVNQINAKKKAQGDSSQDAST